MDNEKLNILQFLIENHDKTYSIRQIALQRKINYKSAYMNIKTLAKEGVISVQKQGNTTNCLFNQKWNASVFCVEYARLQNLLKNKNFLVIYNRLARINAQFILLLFGSYVKGQATKHSDIDLLLITNDPKPIEREIHLIPLKIHLTHITYENFNSMLKSKEFTVVSEAIKKNIMLFGVEAYYRLIKNAQ